MSDSVNRRWQAFTGMTSSSVDSNVTTSAISVSDCLSKCEQREIMASCVATRYDSSTKTCTLMNNYATELTSNANEHYLELIDGEYHYFCFNKITYTKHEDQQSIENVQIILATLLAMENLQFSFANEVPFIPFYIITTTIQFDVTNLDKHVWKCSFS